MANMEFLRLTGKEKRVGGFDMIWNDGPVYADDTGFEQQRLNSFLGGLKLHKKNKMNFFRFKIFN
jgi:hypothetical protein